MNAELWICPKCKRDFAKKNQRHTRTSVRPEDHLKGKPESISKLFDTFTKEVGNIVPVRYDAISFAINMKSRRHFGMVFIFKDKIKFEFKPSSLIKHPRIIKSASLGGDHTYVLFLKNEHEIDYQLLNWRKKSFEYNS